MIPQIATSLAIGIYVVLSKDAPQTKIVAWANTAARSLAVRLMTLGDRRQSFPLHIAALKYQEHAEDD